MTRKDYKLIAAAIREKVARQLDRDIVPTYEDIAKTLAAALARDNPRFDSARFLKACGV